MKNLYLLLILCIALVSCDVSGNADMHLNAQFNTEVVDSSSILLPKTYSYLKNITPPVGVKPIIKVVEEVDSNYIACYADDLFNEYCDNKYSGSTFKERGVLIVASKKPELVQVRVGDTYSLYCRMHGSAAGAGYLKMQKLVKEQGIDAICPIALENVFRDIEYCRQLNWHKKLFLKISFVNIDLLLGNLATPSESLFNQIYFRPLLFIIGFTRSILHNWLLSFVVIAGIYLSIKTIIQKKIKNFIENKAKKNSTDDKDYIDNLQTYSTIFNLIGMLIGLIVTIPTFSAISLLSSARIEDIITLQCYNIPVIDIFGPTIHWENTNIGPSLVLILVFLHYLKSLFKGRSQIMLAHLPDEAQQQIISFRSNRYICDQVIRTGNKRALLSKLMSASFNILFSSFVQKNFHEITTTVPDNTYQNDKKNEEKPIDLLFINEHDEVYHKAPFLALSINDHREAIGITFFYAVIISTLLSSTYALYFIALWGWQLCIGVYESITDTQKKFKEFMHLLTPTRLLSRVWITCAISITITLLTCWFITPEFKPISLTPVDTSAALPEDISGLYFATRIDGNETEGATARVEKNNEGNYYMQVYSDQPISRFKLIVDKETGLLHNETLGQGIIIYNKETGSIKIKFSNLWILSN